MEGVHDEAGSWERRPLDGRRRMKSTYRETKGPQIVS